MTFEEAAALKILWQTDEAQVVTDDEPIDPEGDANSPDEPAGSIVKRYGLDVTDTGTYWEVKEALEQLLEEIE